MQKLWIVAVLASLAGCEKPDNASGPGGVTVGEARALDEAARMIDARQPPEELLHPFNVPWPEGQPTEAAREAPAGMTPKASRAGS